MNRKEKLIQVVFFLLAIGFLFIPFYSAFISGLLRWHISQPRLWKDAIELVMYLAMILALSAVAKRKKGIIILAVCSIYLLSAGTLPECLVSYIYIEVLSWIGRSCLTTLTKGQNKHSAGVHFLVGSLVWGTFAIIMSLLNMGTINDLRALTIILFLLAVVNPKSGCSFDDILLVKYVKYLNKIEKNEFLVNLFFVTIMLISCARVNDYIEYDSLWYGLYTDKNLFGENSFYDFLGYTEFVFYYPKFKELILAPISGLGMAGYLIAPNLWIMLLCVVEVYKFLTEQIKKSKLQILGVVYMIFSTACIIGISSTAKSDTMSYFYILLLILYFVKYLETKEQTLLWIALSAGVMSYTTKATSFLFATIVFFCIFIAMIFLFLSKKIKIERPNLLGIVLMGGACLVFLGVMYRTLKLTGYPTYRAGVGFWSALGFSGEPYFGTRDSVATVPQPNRVLAWFFDINQTGKHPLWIGNYSLFLGLYCFILGKRKHNNNHKFMFYTTILLVVVSMYYLITQRSPDGNYFGIAVIVATCYSFIRISEAECWEKCKKLCSAWIGAFMLLNLIFVFVIHPSWVAGTKFTNEPISLWISEETKYEKKKQSMKAQGLYDIDEELKNNTDGQDLIIADGVNGAGAPQVLLMNLNARVEMAVGIFNRSLSGANIDNYSDFFEYIDYVGVEGFIIARDDSGYSEFNEYVKQYISENGCIRQVDTNKYSYYKIR